MDPSTPHFQTNTAPYIYQKLIINTTIVQRWETIKEVEFDPKKMKKIYIAKKMYAL